MFCYGDYVKVIIECYYWSLDIVTSYDKEKYRDLLRIETNAIAATTKIRAEVQRDIDSAIRSKKDAEYKSQLAKQRAAERSKVYLLLNKNKNKSKVRISKKELQQKLKEREELARIQQDLANTRFPNRTKMSLVKRVDRLEICTTQNLAVVDRLLEFWIAKVCPFTSDHLEPTKRQEVTTTTTTEMQQQVDIFAGSSGN